MVPHCPAGLRFSLLYDGRCLTAEDGFGCGVALAPCAEAGEVNATLQTWRLELADNTTGHYRVHALAKEGQEDHASCTNRHDDAECASWARSGECAGNPGFMQVNCRRACGECSPKPACSVWSHRTPSSVQVQS